MTEAWKVTLILETVIFQYNIVLQTAFTRAVSTQQPSIDFEMLPNK